MLSIMQSPSYKTKLHLLVLPTFVLLTLLLVVRQSTTAYNDIYRNDTFAPGSADSVSVPRRSELIEEYVKGFPMLREPNQLAGTLEANEVEPRDENGRSPSGRVLFDWARTYKMFVFGDSYTTIYANYTETGTGSGHYEGLHHKAIDMKWADYLYAVFQDFHGMQYWNFARPGAVIDPDIVPPGTKKWGTFQDQLEEFERMFTPMPGPRQVDWYAEATLFIAFFGINDLGRLNREDLGRQEIPSTTQRLARSLVDSLRRIHAKGGRSFLIINAPPLELSPKYSHSDEPGFKSRDLVAESVKAYNSFLKEELDAWKAEDGPLSGNGPSQIGAEGKNVMLFDLENYWRIILEYPELFGMTDCARYQMWIGDHRRNPGRMGFCYDDNQHISWSAAELLARNVHGFLLRHSWSFQRANATQSDRFG